MIYTGLNSKIAEKSFCYPDSTAKLQVARSQQPAAN
jgi:hypothetical protein